MADLRASAPFYPDRRSLESEMIPQLIGEVAGVRRRDLIRVVCKEPEYRWPHVDLRPVENPGLRTASARGLMLNHRQGYDPIQIGGLDRSGELRIGRADLLKAGIPPQAGLRAHVDGLGKIEKTQFVLA